MWRDLVWPSQEWVSWNCFWVFLLLYRYNRSHWTLSLSGFYGCMFINWFTWQVGGRKERVWEHLVHLSCHVSGGGGADESESDTLNLPRGFAGLWLEWRISVLVAHTKQWVYGSVCQYISESVGFDFSHSRSAFCSTWLLDVTERSPDLTGTPKTVTVWSEATHFPLNLQRLHVLGPAQITLAACRWHSHHTITEVPTSPNLQKIIFELFQ